MEERSAQLYNAALEKFDRMVPPPAPPQLPAPVQKKQLVRGRSYVHLARDYGGGGEK
jgi:hypothetical protein